MYNYTSLINPEQIRNRTGRLFMYSTLHSFTNMIYLVQICPHPLLAGFASSRRYSEFNKKKREREKSFIQPLEVAVVDSARHPPQLSLSVMPTTKKKKRQKPDPAEGRGINLRCTGGRPFTARGRSSAHIHRGHLCGNVFSSNNKGHA